MSAGAGARRGGVWLFLLITFAWSWAVAAYAYIRSGADPLVFDALSNSDYPLLLVITYQAGPGVAAFLCVLIYDRRRFFEALGLNRNPFNIWLLVAFLAPVLITVASYYVTGAFSGREILSLGEAYQRQFEQAGVDIESLPVTVEQYAIIQLALAPFIAGVVNTIAFILTEEAGWRGFLWDRWRRLPFWRHALLTGFIWGVWHAPIVALGHNYPGMPVWGPIIFTLWVMLITPMIALIRERGGTMVHAAMFHGVLNGVSGITVVLMADASMPWRGTLGLGGFAALAGGVVLVALYRAVRRPMSA
jgi:hypothetical protein